MTTLLNIVKMSVSGAPGTGDIALGSAVNGWVSFTTSGATNGMKVVYNVTDGTAQGTETATYSTTGPSLTSRSNTISTTGSLLSLSANAIITGVARAEDILNKTGDTMTGKLVTLASATGAAGFNIPAGTAPSSPVNGDLWSTTAGFYGRANGTTVGPFIDASGVSGVDWSTINTTTISGSPSQVEWTGLDCEEVLLFFNAVTVSTSAIVQIQFDTGSGYGAALSLTAQQAGPYSGTLQLTGLKRGNLQGVGIVTNSSLPISANTGLRAIATSLGAQVTAIKLTTSAGTFGTSGSIAMQTR